MIPKIIHYVWVGDKVMPKDVIKCRKSWKKFCPDYTLKQWGNRDARKIKNKYMMQAMDNHMFAFVSDYIRLYALYEYGGIYCDTDLEITNNIDKFLDKDFVIGQEQSGDVFLIGTAFMAATRHNPLIKELLDMYENISFINPDGTLDKTTNVQRIYDFLTSKYDIPTLTGDSTIEFLPGHMIYPCYFFQHKKSGCENYSIHHFMASWLHDIPGMYKKNMTTRALWILRKICPVKSWRKKIKSIQEGIK